MWSSRLMLVIDLAMSTFRFLDTVELLADGAWLWLDVVVDVAVETDGSTLLLLLLLLLLRLVLLEPRPSGFRVLLVDVPAPDRLSKLLVLLVPARDDDASFRALPLLLVLVACNSAPKPALKLLVNCSLPEPLPVELVRADVLRFWAWLLCSLIEAAARLLPPVPLLDTWAVELELLLAAMLVAVGILLLLVGILLLLLLAATMAASLELSLFFDDFDDFSRDDEEDEDDEEADEWEKLLFDELLPPSLSFSLLDPEPDCLPMLLLCLSL